MDALGSVFGGLITKSMQPSIPKIGNIAGGASSAYFGAPTPSQIAARQKLEEQIAGATNPAKRQKFQKKLDALNKSESLQGDQAYLKTVLDQQSKYLPMFNDLALSMFNQYAPQQIEMQAKYGADLANAYQSAQEGLAPEFFQNRSAYGQWLGNQVGQGLSADQMGFFSQQARAAQAARGLADSPLGSTQESRYLTEMDLAQQQRNAANMQSYLDSYRLPFVPQVVDINGMPGAGLAGNSLMPLGYNEFFAGQGALTNAKFNRQQAYAQQMGGALGDLASGQAAMDTMSQLGGIVGSFTGGGGGGGMKGIGGF